MWEWEEDTGNSIVIREVIGRETACAIVVDEEITDTERKRAQLICDAVNRFIGYPDAHHPRSPKKRKS